MKPKKMCVVVMIAAISLVLILPSLSFSQEIKLAAGAAPAEWLARIKGPFENTSGLKLNVVTKGAVQLVQDLDKGAVEASIAGLSFQDWMDVVTKEGYKIPQQVAASAEESASASEEMNAHADNMKAHVAALVIMVSGCVERSGAVNAKEERIAATRLPERVFRS